MHAFTQHACNPHDCTGTMVCIDEGDAEGGPILLRKVVLDVEFEGFLRIPKTTEQNTGSSAWYEIT